MIPITIFFYAGTEVKEFEIVLPAYDYSVDEDLEKAWAINAETREDLLNAKLREIERTNLKAIIRCRREHKFELVAQSKMNYDTRYVETGSQEGSGDDSG
jgi:hypothetical protein